MNLFGYYKLTKPKEYASDWVYIIDNAIRQANRKVCLILGIRRCCLTKDACLTFSDLEVIGLHLFEKNTEIDEFLALAIAKTGVPVQICSDEGPDIMPSIRRTQKTHPTIKHVPDITHKVSNLLKKMLDKCSKWNRFIERLNKSKNRLKQSKLFYLSPPNIRGKSRFMNAHGAVEWALKTLAMLDKLKPGDNNRDEILEKLGWLTKSRKAVEGFADLFRLGELAKGYFRESHIAHNGWKELQTKLHAQAVTDQGMVLAAAISAYAMEQCAKVCEGPLMLGCSEIIESAYGKLKNLDRECGNSGFTSSVIGLAACFGKTELATVQAAFESSRPVDVDDWISANVGDTPLRLRRAHLKSSVRPLKCHKRQ